MHDTTGFGVEVEPHPLSSPLFHLALGRRVLEPCGRIGTALAKAREISVVYDPFRIVRHQETVG